MGYRFLPSDNNLEMYSPVGVLKRFRKAVADEGGNIQAVFDKKHKYKTLLELWYASALAVAIYKWQGFQFFMLPSESPDVHFIRKVGSSEQEGFSLEIMTLFDHSKKVFDGDYESLAASVWDKKGQKDYDRTELLLVSRLVGQINVDAFADQIARFEWKFIRIWFSVFNQTANTWTIFEIYPCPADGKVAKLTVGLSELPY